MRLGGKALAAVAVGLFALATAGAGHAAAHGGRRHVRVMTGGHLRPGHVARIRVTGFPGRGRTEVSFFPTAICEDECAAPSLPAGRTDADGAGTLRVRVPGTFLDRRGRHVYFRDRERIDLEVTWEGDDGGFAFGSAEPIIVRDHGGARQARPAAPSRLATRISTPSAPAPRAPLPVPTGFELHGTNGYTLDVIGGPPRKGAPGAVLIIAAAKGREVTYSAPATVTETSIQADLGELGQISVEFQRSDRPKTVGCHGRSVRFDSGSWVGTIAFHGEEGYTDVEAASVPGSVEYLVGALCGPIYSESNLGPRKGAELRVRNPGLGPQLSVYKHRPGAAAQITARLSEYEDGIAIQRTTSAWMPGRDFSYDRRLRTATVTPPALFDGSARFDLGAKAGRRWSGDLTVDMPGRADVPLTGPLLRASLSPSE